MLSYLKKTWDSLTHSEIKAGEQPVGSLVPSKLNKIIEEYLERDNTLDIRPPHDLYELVNLYKAQALEMEAHVRPIQNDFKEATVEKIKGKKDYVTTTKELEGGKIQHFIGKAHDTMFSGRTYIIDDKNVIVSTYGLFEKDEASDNYSCSGFALIENGEELAKQTGVEWKIVKMVNDKIEQNYLCYQQLSAGSHKYEVTGKPSVFTYKNWLLNIVVPINNDQYKVYSIKNNEKQQVLEMYHVDASNNRIQNAEEACYNYLGQYYHKNQGLGSVILEPNLRYDGQYDSTNYSISGSGSLIQIAPFKKITGTFSNGHIVAGRIETADYVYEGPIEEDDPAGVGRLTYMNGNVYEGPFVDGLPQGRGKYTSQIRLSVYEGDFNCSFKEGKGVENFQNGDVYEGNFKMNLWQGEGKLIKANGDYYIGQFDEGVYHGDGELKENGAITKGKWNHGELITEGTSANNKDEKLAGQKSAGNSEERQ